MENIDLTSVVRRLSPGTQFIAGKPADEDVWTFNGEADEQ
ncbi:hypothetical protein GGD41_000148 [Paraburkholderia bryophila]|uniref:Uncharacterized protein n=1 Tax=Paraburkholderia bryophila TaxID=420952 RepID=A0A7Z0AXW9_9BURK|nr:hypothetical protein [Paraburkholderia bryophila]NYH24537.1 hypothetical protein [Paraburkholderia bryophila]